MGKAWYPQRNPRALLSEKKGRCGEPHLLILADHGKEGADQMGWSPEDRTRTKEYNQKGGFGPHTEEFTNNQNFQK